MLGQFSVHDAIDFSKNSFKLTDQFQRDIQNSRNPILVALVGPARSGKSTLANMILKPFIPKNNKDISNDVFKTDEGNVPVTLKIQYCEIKLSTLIQNHHLAINPDFDSDLFILDCEGIDSLGEVTQSLRKAIFTLLQISTVNIYVSKNIDRSNIYDLKAFFALPGLIPGSRHKLKKANCIVLTDIGVPGKPSEEEYEMKRKENDSKELQKFLSHLNERHITFPKENASFFAQPKWRDEKHYLESIKDLIRFIVSNASQQMKIPGKTLIEIFNQCIQFISQINELDNPDIRLEKIIKHLIDGYFEKAYKESIKVLDVKFEIVVKNKNINELINLSKTNFVKPIQDQIIISFKKNANKIFEDLTNMFPKKFEEYVQKINYYVRENCLNKYHNLCKNKVIPFVANSISEQSKEEIQFYYNQHKVSSLSEKDKGSAILLFQNRYGDLFFKNISSIHPSLTSSNEFKSILNDLNCAIAKEISIIYERIVADKTIFNNAQFALNKYQQERKKHEILIYDVFEAILPVKQGGKPRETRIRMENERDQ